MCRAHIALQEFQAITMMLHRMDFHLSGKVVALHLYNITAKPFHVIKVVQCLLFFPGWPARYWVWLTSMVLLLFQHTCLPTSMWRQIICPRIDCFQSGIFSFRWLRQLFTFGAFWRWNCWHVLILLNASIITSWKLHYLWGPWGWIPSAILGLFSYVFPPPALVPLVLSKFLTEHVSGHLRHFILVAPFWMEAPWLPIIHNMLADIPWWCPIIKDLIVDVSVSQELKGLQYLHLTLWQLSNVCCADRGSLPQSIRQWWGQREHQHQRSTSSAGRNGQVGVLNKVYQSMPSLLLN